MLCNSCGKELQPGETYCGCGTAVGTSRVARHRRRLGILWMGYAIFTLLSGMMMLFIGVTAILSSGRMSHWEEGVEVSATLFQNAVPALIGALVLVWGIVSLMAGRGLLQRVSWGRKLAVVIGIFSLLFSFLFGGVMGAVLFNPIFSLCSILFGTALGTYTLWVLMSRKAKREYDAVSGQS